MIDNAAITKNAIPAKNLSPVINHTINAAKAAGRRNKSALTMKIIIIPTRTKINNPISPRVSHSKPNTTKHLT